jgi:hypothetical protein
MEGWYNKPKEIEKPGGEPGFSMNHSDKESIR